MKPEELKARQKQLQIELAEIENKLSKAEAPQLVVGPNCANLVNLCSDYIRFLTSEDYCSDNNYKHFIYECVMETFYGKDVWKFINSRT